MDEEHQNSLYQTAVKVLIDLHTASEEMERLRHEQLLPHASSDTKCAYHAAVDRWHVQLSLALETGYALKRYCAYDYEKNRIIQLQAEMGALNRMLEELPKESVIERVGLTERKQEIEAKLGTPKSVKSPIQKEDYLNRIEELKALTEGWLDRAGKLIQPAAIAIPEMLKDVLVASNIAGWQDGTGLSVLPYLYSTPEGGLQAEWCVLGYSENIVLNMYPDGSVELSWTVSGEDKSIALKPEEVNRESLARALNALGGEQ